MAIQARNAEMVSLLSADFVSKTDSAYLAGIVAGSILTLPGLVAFWPMQVAVNDDILYILSNVEIHAAGGNGSIMLQGTNVNSHFNHSTTENTYIRGGKTGAAVLLNDSHNGNVYLAGGGGLTTFGGIIGEAWNNLSFNTGWANLGGGWRNGQYKKVGDLVIVCGFVVRFSGSDALIATLPSGYRPTAPERWATTSVGAFAAVQIDTDGSMTVVAGSPDTNLTLGGIIFSTA